MGLTNTVMCTRQASNRGTVEPIFCCALCFNRYRHQQSKSPKAFSPSLSLWTCKTTLQSEQDHRVWTQNYFLSRTYPTQSEWIPPPAAMMEWLLLTDKLAVLRPTAKCGGETSFPNLSLGCWHSVRCTSFHTQHKLRTVPHYLGLAQFPQAGRTPRSKPQRGSLDLCTYNLPRDSK